MRPARRRARRPGPGRSPRSSSRTRRRKAASCGSRAAGPCSRGSYHSVSLQRVELVVGQSKDVLVDLSIVLAEPRRAALDRSRRSRQAWIDTLHLHRADCRVVDLDDIAARGIVRILEDVADAERAGDRHLCRVHDRLDLVRGPLAAPIGDDPVDLIAVPSAIGERLEAGIAGELGLADRLCEPREEAVARGDDRNELAVFRLPVVEWGGVLQAVAFAAAHDAEAVVAR